MSICITNKGISRKLFANIEHRSVYHTIYDGNDKCVRMKKKKKCEERMNKRAKKRRRKRKTKQNNKKQ